MFQTDAPPAIPLWINGHAFLTVTPAFQDVRDPLNGKVLRRIPLCGADEVRMAVAAAQAALASWTGLPATVRAALLSAVGDALSSYSDHFARLISVESGKESQLAVAEIGESVTLLKSVMGRKDSGVVAIVGNGAMPLLAPLRLAVPSL